MIYINNWPLWTTDRKYWHMLTTDWINNWPPLTTACYKCQVKLTSSCYFFQTMSQWFQKKNNFSYSSADNSAIILSSDVTCPQDAQNWGVKNIDWTEDTNAVTNVVEENYFRVPDHDRVNHASKTTPTGFPDVKIICAQGRNICPGKQKVPCT